MSDPATTSPGTVEATSIVATPAVEPAVVPPVDPAVTAPEAKPASVLDAPTVPEPLDAEKLTVPDGIDTKGEAFTEFTGLAAELGITNEVAQKLIDYHHKHQTAASAALAASWQSTQDGWVAEVKADKEIGNLDTLRQTIAKVADNPQLTDPGFKEALAFTGAGNNPAVLRTLYRWAQALGEGTSVIGGVPARQANGALSTSGPASLATAIYGANGPHKGGPNLG